MANDNTRLAELVREGLEPTRADIALLARTYLAGSVDEAAIDRLHQQFRELYADSDRRQAEGSAFRANSRRYEGQAWKELLSPHEHRPSPAELALWLAIVTPGYPPPRPFCPPEFVGRWKERESSCVWNLAPDGAFDTTEPRIAELDVRRWCVHYVERRGDYHRDEIWLLGNQRHNVLPRHLIILECTSNRLSVLRAGGDFPDVEYNLMRSA